MKRSSIILASASAICLMAHALPLCAQHELECFINDPDKAGMTNIRATPGGKVLFQVDGQGGYDLTVIVQQGGWWRIKDPVEVFGDDMKDPKAEAWIHRSVLALAALFSVCPLIGTDPVPKEYIICTLGFCTLAVLMRRWKTRGRLILAGCTAAAAAGVFLTVPKSERLLFLQSHLWVLVILLGSILCVLLVIHHLIFFVNYCPTAYN